MSIRIMSEVWQHSRAGGSELLCLLAIADFANDDGYAFPSVATLAVRIRKSERYAQYLLNKLVAAGELQIEPNAGRRGCNLYRVQAHQGPVQPASPAKPGSPVKPVSGRGATRCAKGVNPIAPEPLLNHQEPSIARNAGFEAFWTAYPKKKSRGDAEKAWKALKADAELAGLIVQAVQRAKESDDWRKEGGRYVPYPATWLRAKGWMDEAATADIPLWDR
ncbi:MAG: helix-turn-helix domain-containing protein [Burkholderiaceae bacterium]|nr:helix-turn-helix domain-containing protein [Burkholderiaceae bacterium]